MSYEANGLKDQPGRMELQLLSISLLEANTGRMIEHYNSQVTAFQRVTHPESHAATSPQKAEIVKKVC